MVRKYPQKGPEELLGDLVASTPGDEGKWFATAKEVGLFDGAIHLANRTPCDPKTLTRAARDFADERPEFAVEADWRPWAGSARATAIEITGLDVWAAYANTVKAAEKPEAAVAEVRRNHLAADGVLAKDRHHSSSGLDSDSGGRDLSSGPGCYGRNGHEDAAADAALLARAAGRPVRALDA